MRHRGNSVSTLVFLATVVLGAAAWAEDANEERGGRRGGRGGPRHRGGGRSQRVDKARLLSSEQVRDELGLREDQVEKLSEFRAANGPGVRGPRGRPDGDGPSEEDRAARRADFEARRAERSAAIDAVLDEVQRTRLDQILLQQAGVRGLLSEDVVAALGLSQGQVDAIEGALPARGEAAGRRRGGRRQRSGDGSASDGEERPRHGRRGEVLEAALAQLSPAQRAAYENLKGEPFELDRSTLRGRGGAGRRGAGRRGAEGGGRRQRPPVDEV